MRSPDRVLVTGANGFVGTRLCRDLLASGHEVVAAVRKPDLAPPGTRPFRIEELGPRTDWSGALEGVRRVIHLAARVHVMRDDAQDPLTEHRRINTEGTRALGEAAAASGVQRFVFVSSVKVNGEATARGARFHPDTPPAPVDPYGIAKWEAERALREIEARGKLQVVVVRPPLVYGPAVRANFRALLRLCRMGVPLPFGAVDNRRSLVFVGNLSAALCTAATHPAAAGRTYFASDDADLSTGELVRRIGQAMGKTIRLLPVPTTWLRLGARALGRGDMIERLVGSLCVDAGPLRRELGWCPPFPVDSALRETTDWYLASGA